MLPFRPALPLALPIEVQRFAHGHFVGSIGLHGHHFNEVILFESDGDVHRVGPVELQRTPGSVDTIGEDQVHELDLRPGAAGWMLMFPLRAVEQAKVSSRMVGWFSRPGDDGGGRCVVSAARMKRLTRYFSALASNQQIDSGANRCATTALFSALLHELAGAHDLQLPEHAMHRHFQSLLETIDESYAQPLTLERLACSVGLSKAYLTTELRQKTGRTAMQWVLERRLREARRLLAESDLTVTRLAYDLGFEDSSHFARRFRSVHGVSPAAWREAERARRKAEISYRHADGAFDILSRGRMSEG